MQGMLIRKHQWESTTKKASNRYLRMTGPLYEDFPLSIWRFCFRSWDKVCVVLKGNQIGFYKDQKTYQTSPEATYRGEPPIDIAGGAAEIATDYTKKKNVFRLK